MHNYYNSISLWQVQQKMCWAATVQTTAAGRHL